MSKHICAQQSEEKTATHPWLSANLTASSVGNAMAFTPAFMAKTSVLARCLPFGRMHPKTIGVVGSINLAAAITLAMSKGSGGLTLLISVPRIGMKAITTTADGSYFETISNACSSPFSFP
jgi:hypothetical protein